MGVKFSVRQTIFSINSSRPKQALVPGEVTRQMWWMQAQGARFISNLDRRPALSLTTHLVNCDSGSNLVREFRHSHWFPCGPRSRCDQMCLGACR